MTKSKVAIIRCESYDEKEVYNAVKKGIELIGGIESIVKEGEKILVKPNNLAGCDPNLSVTTHPSVFEAIIKILLEKEANVIYGDSPGFEKPLVSLEKSGFTRVAEKYRVKLGDFEKGKSIDFLDGTSCKKFPIANACLENDGIVNICKMKTHGLTRITGSVKNNFGCIYGYNKASFHAKFPNPTEFSKMLVDLSNLLKVRLFIMDGIIAMEGNGPRSGEPVKMNCIIVSTDPVAIDATFARIIDIDPLFIPTIKYGNIMGLGNYSLDEIEYLGDSIDGFINKNFNVIRKPVRNYSLRSFIPSFIRNRVLPRPIIDINKCIKCGICVNACPIEDKAINFKGRDMTNPPVYNYNKCIRCYCCQEMCPQKAIYISKGIIKRNKKIT